MIEELSQLNKLSTEGTSRIRTISTATKTLNSLALKRPVDPEETKASAEKVAELTAAINVELDKQKALFAEVKKLTDQLAQAQVADAKGLPPLDLARQLRSVVDTVQTDLASMQGSVGTTLRGFDVELKGIVVVENNETRVMLPPPTEKLEAHQVSTFKMSFGTVPLVRSGACATDSPQ